MDALIQGTISALGYLEDGVYYPEPDCFETIRDLIRFLRTDDKVMLARKICGELNIIENDLIPIIKSPNLKDNMFDITLRLLANLTQPAIVSLQGRPPEDRDEWQTYWILEDNLRRAKHAFADVTFFSILKDHLEKYFLNTDWESRLEENRLVMERIVVLLRYIFSISPTERDGRRTAAESNSHDRLIIAFLDSGIDKILTNIGTQSKEHEFHLSIMVIFALILKEHKPADIICAGRARTEAEKQKAEEELRQVVEAEKAKLAAQKRKILATRHSRFSGSYVVKGMSAVNKERDLVVVKPIKNISELSFLEERKTKKITARNRRPFEAEQKTHLSSMDVRIKLKQFIEEDLMKCFNRLMKSTKQLAFDTRLSAGQKNADLYYFLLMRFMLEYTRLAGLSSSNVSMCIPVEAFHHIQVHLDNYLESATAQKKEAKSYGLRAQYALSAYKELILFHQYLLDKGTPEEKEFAKRTCYHIMTVEEYREMGFALIRKYKPGFLSKTFLRELVLATHYYFRLLERSVKAGQLTTVTKKTRIRRTGARNKKIVDDSAGLTPLPAVVDSMKADEMDEVWPKIVDEVRDIILGNVEPSDDQIPINSLLDVQDEQHQKFAMLKIQRSLRERRPTDALGMYRASRAIWPTEGIFGDPNKSVDEQVEEIREIFFADLKEVADELLKAETVVHKKFTVEPMFDEGGEEDEYSDEEEEPDRYETKEVKFDLKEYVAFYARTDVLRWYVFLLNDFATNPAELNHALVKLLHRVSFDLDMPTRLFQLSLFRIFAQVRSQLGGMAKEELKKHPLFELYNFGYHLLKQFFKCFERLEEKLAPEILFWKGPKECYEIQNGYGTYDEAKHSKQGNEYTWSEELEDELRSLYNEYRDMDERPEGMDVLDFIEPNLSRPRTRKQILKKLKEFALDPLGAKANKGSIMDRNFPIIEVKKLIEQYNEKEEKDEDMINFLRTRLAETHGEFSRQKIIKQITYLGIVYERKPAQKKYQWTDGLKSELTALKLQYDEMDQEDHELIDIVDYVMRRLSEKKPRRQVERELEALGAVIKRREKPSQKEWSEGLKLELAALKQQYDELEAEERESNDIVDYVMRRLSEKRARRQVEKELEALGAVIKRREKPKSTKKQLRSPSTSDDEGSGPSGDSEHSGGSDADLELEDDSDHDEVRHKKLPSRRERRSSRGSSAAESAANGRRTPEEAALTSPMKTQSPIKKKRRLLASSDEEDNADLGDDVDKPAMPPRHDDSDAEGSSRGKAAAEEYRPIRTPSANDEIASSPVKTQSSIRKTKRVLANSDEEDNAVVEDQLDGLPRDAEGSSRGPSATRSVEEERRSTDTPSLGAAQVEDESPVKVVPSVKKRKRLLASSDEEDNAADSAEELKDDIPRPESPVPLQRKKNRVVLSDSDEN